jgi:hypothetical protein
MMVSSFTDESHYFPPENPFGWQKSSQLRRNDLNKMDKKYTLVQVANGTLPFSLAVPYC